jgi:hypothetical protein
MERGFDSFRQLQAQLATQLAGALRLPSSKAIAVQLTLAAVIAVGATHAPQAQAGEYQQGQQGQTQYSPDWTGTKAKVGAGIGAVAGNLLGKFTDKNRKVTTIVGAALGGVLGAVDGGRDKAAMEAQQFQSNAQKSPFPRLSHERDRQLAVMQHDAVLKRAAYVAVLKDAKEAEIDKSLMPGDKDAQQRYQTAVIEASKALREEKVATNTFTSAVRSLIGQYNVSEYAPAFAKLSQPARIGDTSYAKLSTYVTDMLVKKGAEVEVETSLRSSEPIANTMF